MTNLTKQNDTTEPPLACDGFERDPHSEFCNKCGYPLREHSQLPKPTLKVPMPPVKPPKETHPTSNVRTPREHDLKVWPEFYSKLESGEKTFELRIDDRGYRAGDILFLREWNPRMEAYTGNSMRRRVTYLMSGLGLQKDFVVMALGLTDETSPDARDAARYRFLRQPGNALVYAKDRHAWGQNASGHVRYDTAEQLDAAVDAAMGSAVETSLPHGFVMVAQCASCGVEDKPNAVHTSTCAAAPYQRVRPTQKASVKPVCDKCQTPMIQVSHSTWEYDCEHGVVENGKAKP